MPRQYTFRTTRETAWLDDILTTVPDKDRARYIRDLIIKGLGSDTRPSVLQTEHKPNTFVTQTEDKPNTTTPIPPNEEEEIVIESEPIDLDSNLDNLFD